MTKYFKTITQQKDVLDYKILINMETQDYTQRQFMIFEISELNQIDFTQVLETSEQTLRRSIDGTLTFVKWDNEIPECVNNLTTKQGPYTYGEILEILNTPTWTSDELTV